jgi:hypothetical protein
LQTGATLFQIGGAKSWTAVTALCKLVQPCSKLVVQKAELLELLR